MPSLKKEKMNLEKQCPICKKIIKIVAYRSRCNDWDFYKYSYPEVNKAKFMHNIFCVSLDDILNQAHAKTYEKKK